MGRTAKPLLRKLSAEECSNVAETLLRNNGMFIKKHKDHARIWCGQCNTEERISLELAKQIEKSHLCPFCYQRVELHKKKNYCFNQTLVRIDNYGYYVKVSKKLGSKPKIYHKQVAYWAEDGFYARNLFKSMYSWVFRNDYQWRHYWGDHKKYTQWRKRSTKSFNSLDMMFIHYEYLNDGLWDHRSKREYLESLYLPEVKSNQKKLFMDNHLNREQILATIVFDLKSIKEIYKYNAYIRSQDFRDIRHQLNIYHLDYLYRNKISLSDYMDYIDQCDTLGIKPSKPKDFYKVHSELADEIKIMHESERNKQIQKIAKKLMHKSHKYKTVEISPLMDVRDIVETGAELHNCIKTYIGRYADKKTDLYVLRDKGVRMVAIEVRKGELIQARADYNREPESKYKRIIKQWMEEAYA